MRVHKTGPGPSYEAFVPLRMAQRSPDGKSVNGWKQWHRFPVKITPDGKITTPAPVPAPLWEEAAAAILDLERLAGRL